jgi:hypothetical protein
MLDKTDFTNQKGRLIPDIFSLLDSKRTRCATLAYASAYVILTYSEDRRETGKIGDYAKPTK